MVSIILVISMICVSVVAAAYYFRARKRAVGISYLENVSVSRQWLMQHQADDRS